MTFRDPLSQKAELHCDFCDVPNPEPSKTYACQSFDTMAVLTGARVIEPARFAGTPIKLMSSVGSWLACQTCAALIDANDIDGLTDRAVEHLSSPTETPEQTEFLRQFMRRQNEQFMKLRLAIQ
jgi:hypothetical protein